jgi:hypothetical protein
MLSCVPENSLLRITQNRFKQGIEKLTKITKYSQTQLLIKYITAALKATCFGSTYWAIISPIQ